MSIVRTASGLMSPTTGNFNLPLKFVTTFIFGMISFTVNLVASFSVWKPLLWKWNEMGTVRCC